VTERLATFDFRDDAPYAADRVRWGKDVHLDGRPLMDRLARLLPTPAADLMEIATAVYAADRLTPRDHGDTYQLGWSRRLRLHIPVRQPDRWEKLRGPITELLSWLTDDEWDLHFHSSGQAWSPLGRAQGYLFPAVPPQAHVALFSGGLDSTAGLAIDLATRPAIDVIAVRVVTNGRMAHGQETVLGYFGERVHDCSFQVHLASGRSREPSQRTRGFLFLSAGVATALTARKNVLRVYENGIGAVNLPLVESQRGSQAPHAVHPRTLAMMEKLATSLNEGSCFRIELPHLWSTKAELLRQAPQRMAGAYTSSMSCDRAFASRLQGALQCGTCTSCILRRQSVLASGLLQVDARRTYRRDLSSTPRPYTLDASLWQAHRISSALNSTDPWSAFVQEFPQVLDVPGVESESGRSAILRLYGQYCAEWRSLAARLGVDMSKWGLEGAAAA
jgi:hypothetical protein